MEDPKGPPGDTLSLLMRTRYIVGKSAWGEQVRLISGKLFSAQHVRYIAYTTYYAIRTRTRCSPAYSRHGPFTTVLQRHALSRLGRRVV